MVLRVLKSSFFGERLWICWDPPGFDEKTLHGCKMCIGGFVESHGVAVHMCHASHPVMVQMDLGV